MFSDKEVREELVPSCPITLRLGRSLVKPAKKVQFEIADPDRVEEANISRQAFCDKEIGLPKAQALALRDAFVSNLHRT
jgi:molybdopterin/thiamine biosynthesis adenylyltransferase